MAPIKAVAIALLFSCVLLAGCSSTTRPRDEDPSPAPPSNPRYKAGDVLVGFCAEVTEEQAGAMFAAHRLPWVSGFPKRFAYWVEVESGDSEAHATWLSESSIVIFAEHRGNPNGRAGADYIIVSFNETATTESAQTLIDSRPGLRVSSTLVAPKVAVASVEPGQEQHWIEVLEKESIVRYATLNYLAYPGSLAESIPNVLTGFVPAALQSPASGPSAARSDLEKSGNTDAVWRPQRALLRTAWLSGSAGWTASVRNGVNTPDERQGVV